MDNNTDNKSVLRERVQKQVVELITSGLEAGTLSEDRARGIAKMILETLPENLNDQDLMFLIPKLDDEFRELSDVVLPIILEYELKLRQAVEQKVLELLRARKFKEATEAAQKGIELSRLLN